MTKEEFLAQPLRVWWSLHKPLIEDEWLAQAWEENAHFQGEVTYEFAREASKIGTLEGLQTDLLHLARVLPLARMVELYNGIRKSAFWREVEFRPTFERVFGEKMVTFPLALSDANIKDLLLKEDEA